MLFILLTVFILFIFYGEVCTLNSSRKLVLVLCLAGHAFHRITNWFSSIFYHIYVICIRPYGAEW